MSTVILVAGLVLAVLVLAYDVVRLRVKRRQLRSELRVQRAVEEHRLEVAAEKAQARERELVVRVSELSGELEVSEEKAAYLVGRLDVVRKEATAASLVLLSRLGREREEHTRALAAGVPVYSVLALEQAAGAGR